MMELNNQISTLLGGGNKKSKSIKTMSKRHFKKKLKKVEEKNKKGNKKH